MSSNSKPNPHEFGELMFPNNSSSKIDSFGRTLLHYAVESQNDTMVQKLIDSGYDINAVDNFGETPIHIGLKKKNMKILHILASKIYEFYVDEDVGKQWLRTVLNESDWCPPLCKILFPKMKVKSGNVKDLAKILIAEKCYLCYAVFTRKSSLIKTMLDEDSSIGNIVKNSIDAAFYVAICLGYIEIVELLLEYGIDLNIQNKKSKTTLQFVLRWGKHIEKLLFENEIGWNLRHNQNVNALNLAVYLCQIEIAKLFKDLGCTANFNIQDWNGDTALHVAVREGRIRIVKFLLVNGVNVNIPNNAGKIPINSNNLYRTIESREILKLLLDHGSNVSLLDKDNLWQIFDLVLSGSKEVVEILLNSNKVLLARDYFKRTILHNLVKNRNPGVWELLYLRNINVDIRDQFQRTPLMCAAKYRNEIACKILLDKGADVNAVGMLSYKTPLYHAVKNVNSDENVSLIELLLESGAKMSTFTALRILKMELIPEVVRTLLSHMALIDFTIYFITRSPHKVLLGNILYKNYYHLFKHELKAMNTDKIYGDLSLLTLLTANERKTAGYMRNEDLIVKLRSYNSKYHYNSYYNKLLNKRINGAIQLAELVEKASSTLYNLINYVVRFDSYVVNKIISYLDRQDLLNLVNISCDRCVRSQ